MVDVKVNVVVVVAGHCSGMAVEVILVGTVVEVLVVV